MRCVRVIVWGAGGALTDLLVLLGVGWGLTDFV